MTLVLGLHLLLVLIGHLDVVVGDDKQLVTRLEFALTGGNKEVLAASHHDNQGMGRYLQVAQPASAEHHIVGDFYLSGGGFDLFREVDIKVLESLELRRIDRQIELTGNARNGRALHQERDERTEEYDVEEHVGMLNAFGQTHDSKYDGYGTLEAYPAEHHLVLDVILAERRHAEQHGQRTRYKDHDHADDKAREQYLQMEQFGGTDQQTQHEEHDQLAEPGEAVEERLGLALTRELGVTDDESAYIYRQIGITLKEVSHGEDEYAGREHHDRVERLVGQLYLTHQSDDALAEGKTQYSTHDQLDDDVLHNSQSADLGRA